MPCDGKNDNCERRRELLSQLKCLISSMDRKKPCEWDENPCAPPLCAVRTHQPTPDCPILLKPCKSFELRSSIMYRCECIKRNGLQDRCMMWNCMGRPECMTKLYPVCGPGRAALLKLTDLGDMAVVLEKFYNAEQARESALAAYCRLACPDVNAMIPQPCPQEPSCPQPPCCYPQPPCPKPQPLCCYPPPPCPKPQPPCCIMPPFPKPEPVCCYPMPPCPKPQPVCCYPPPPCPKPQPPCCIMPPCPKPEPLCCYITTPCPKPQPPCPTPQPPCAYPSFIQC